MIQIRTNDEAVDAKYMIEQACIKLSPLYLFINEQQIEAIDQRSFELTVEWGRLIIYIWDDERSSSWRVRSYEIKSSGVDLLATNGPGGPGRESVLISLREGLSRQVDEPDLKQKRENYAESLREAIMRKFRLATMVRATTGPGRQQGVPGRYARILMKQKGEKIMVMGVCGDEAQTDIDSVIAAGLIWIGNTKNKPVRLIFCLPQGRSQTAIERLSLIDLSHLKARLECYEYDQEKSELTPVVPLSQGELLNRHPYDLEWPGDNPSSAIWRSRILSLAPDLIEVRPRTGNDGEGFLIHGLEFARQSGRLGAIKFGIAGQTGPSMPILTEASFRDLERLVGSIGRFRCAGSPDRRHPFYRLRAEAWLESLLRRDIHSIDLALNERYVYSQIPTWRAEERYVIDLLTVRQESDGSHRLVVIEIKAVEDLQLPLQGLDYWLRIEQARIRNEFERRGMFRGIRLADKPPLLYLVAPRLRFHRSFETVSGCISSQIELFRVGINTNWREGVKVHSVDRCDSAIIKQL